jgi:uncharacterized protein (DUF2249 family)
LILVKVAAGEAREPADHQRRYLMPYLDLRHLPPPQPMLRTLAASEALARGGRLEVLTPPPPVPLLQLLELRGFEASAHLLHDGSSHVRVRKP